MVNLPNHFARPQTYHLLDIQARENSPEMYRSDCEKIIDSDAMQGSFQKINTWEFTWGKQQDIIPKPMPEMGKSPIKDKS